MDSKLTWPVRRAVPSANAAGPNDRRRRGKQSIGNNDRKMKDILRFPVLSVISLACATGIGVFFRHMGFPETNVVLLYILAVVVTSSMTKGYLPGIILSVAATLTFNYFFTIPIHSLDVYDPSYLITFGIMTIVSIVTGTLNIRGKENAAKARDKEQEILQERYRGNLLRAISHDLRTPLSAILGTADMILDMSRRDDPRYELAMGIRKDAGWLHALVENILSLTRLQDGRVVLNRQPEAVEEIVGSCVAQMENRAEGRRIEVSVPDELMLVPMDARLIMQVLVNLLDNAVKHSPADSIIRLCVWRDAEKGMAVFTVSDEGEGIAQEDLPHIFNTFYTSQVRSSDARVGIGLGLSICESIIQQHGGTIRARNRSDRVGAEFIFTLPMKG